MDRDDTIELGRDYYLIATWERDPTQHVHRDVWHLRNYKDERNFLTLTTPSGRRPSRTTALREAREFIAKR